MRIRERGHKALEATFNFAEVCARALQQQAQIKHTSAVNATMVHEMAVLKRLTFAAQSEKFRERLSAEQKKPAGRGHRRGHGGPGAGGGQAQPTCHAGG